MPGAPIPAGAAGAASLMSATRLSVVRSVEATLVAFWSALLVTFTGSRIPAFTRSTYSSLSASKPKPTLPSFTLLIITAPSSPALAAILKSGDSSALRTTLAPVFSSPSSVAASFSTSFEAWM